ncbi:hypothetical protein ACHQM5_020374 [Ranunculus cassubicifolius]
MAGPATGNRQGARTGPRCICFTLVAVIFLIGLAVLITWLVLRPKQLIYTLETGKVSGLDLHKEHLNGTFDFYLRAYNPNKRVSLYYDSMQAMVYYGGQTIASQTLEPFYQPRRNMTRLEIKPIAHSVGLPSSLARDLRLEKSSEEIEIDIRLKARIRFKVGVWKSSHYTLKVHCSNLEMHLNSTKNFKGHKCDVDT